MAGEVIIGAVVQEILNRVISLAAQGIHLTKKLTAELENLESTLKMIQDVIEDARSREVKEQGAREWLKKLKDVAYDAEDVLDEFATETQLRKMTKKKREKVRKFFSSSNLIVVYSKMAHRIKSINASFDKLQKQANMIQLARTVANTRGRGAADSSQIMHRVTHSKVNELEVVGRDADKEKIVNILINDQNEKAAISVLPIVRMGGLGKTTLAQLAFNDKSVKAHFDKRMWVCVTENFNIHKILKEILENLGERDALTNLDVMIHCLEEQLGGKKFLLVLDDVWNEEKSKWDILKDYLLTMQTAKGSKIIVTTRKDGVGKIMGTLPMHHLELLSEKDSWSIFKNRAFAAGGAPETPRLVEIGKEIVKKCDGLPLAAKALGGLMYSKKEEEEWVCVQNSEIWDLPESESYGILPALRLSYDHLPPHLKQCFTYCSLYPKGQTMDKERLIQEWMAHGFIQQQVQGSTSVSGEEMEDIGNDYFNNLLWNSFFQDVEMNRVAGDIETVKMHDLVYDLAQHVSKAECVISTEKDEDLDRVQGRSTPITWDLDVRHMSVHHQMLKRILLEAASSSSSSSPSPTYDQLHKLRTCLVFFIAGYLDDVNDFLEDFCRIETVFFKCKCLRVLDLSGIWLRPHFPASISNFKLLRFLDLSESEIETLPESITSLCNLQTLRLKNCRRLKELPKEMRKLINLRHLDLLNCINLQQMPVEMGRLRCLQTLSRFVVGQGAGHGITELQHLINLRGCLTIANLENVSSVREGKEANIKDKQNIQILDLVWSSWYINLDTNTIDDDDNDDHDVLLEGLQPHPNLKGLRIANFKGTKFPLWIVEIHSFLPNLVQIYLIRCRRLENVPMLGYLPLLISLHIEGMDFKCIQFYGVVNNSNCSNAVVGRGGGDHEATTVTLFPSLERLWLKDMPNLVEWKEASPSCSSNSIFPCLEHFIIQNCPKLTVTPNCLLPSLKGLVIESSNALLLKQGGSFVANLMSLVSLGIIKCDELKVLPEWLLQNNKNTLRELQITHCPKLEPLPMERLQVLFTSLQWLNITDCPLMPDVSCLDDFQKLLGPERK
ncbi:PREDICTED: putative disease resistance protein RGA3 [Nelumbo nucifera]|uniref:Disease resistance protein RGA3 n=2 Tax=Nelumbo nucifera TaxID=4432 RepID=A0A822YC85_NELNU|nr:PREDICTED: putative disease resistance protein RGA3 [Nelumbo nucifera]DAD31724.1 TPA_asm: hypothetical protein HUJ06_010575 [Nelumbo nucifera]